MEKKKSFRAQTGKEYSEKLDFVRYDAASSHLLHHVFAYAPMYGVQLALRIIEDTSWESWAAPG